jgi:hypothetical protein
VIFFRRLTVFGAAMLVLSACAPLPPNGDGSAPAAAPNAASGAPAALVGPPVPAGPPGETRIVVGGSGGYHVTLKLLPPSQVCDNDAFADGVRYGYALTWNRLVMEQARDSGAKTPPKQKFDASSLQSHEDQYKIQWNGNERTNACAADGYLIGRIVGTHQAGVDLHGGKAAS